MPSSLGPRPTPVPVPVGLSRARRTVLEVLRGEDDPLPLSVLTRLTGLHENTVRGHLEGLARDGLVERERATPVGRGRPAWLWRAATPESSEYAGLAVSLASSLHRSSPDPGRAADEAGLEWGRELARASDSADRESPSGDRDLDARGEVLRLLDVLGFAPDEQPDGRVRLTHCPLLDAARRHPDIVCRVHEGLIKGALESFGDVGTAATLHPFAEPGACTLDLDRE